MEQRCSQLRMPETEDTVDPAPSRMETRSPKPAPQIRPNLRAMIGDGKRWGGLCPALQAFSLIPLAVGAPAGRVEFWVLYLAASLYRGFGMSTGPAWTACATTLVASPLKGAFLRAKHARGTEILVPRFHHPNNDRLRISDSGALGRSSNRKRTAVERLPGAANYQRASIERRVTAPRIGGAQGA